MDISDLSRHSIRVLLADDEPHIRDIVETLLNRANDIDLVGTCVNGQEAVSMCKELRPDILLLDIMMPVMDGFEVARLVRERFPKIKILVLSSIHDYKSVQTMMQNAVDGYVNKSVLVKDLATNIRTACSGEIVFSREVFQHYLGGTLTENKAKDFGLTVREKEILELILEGLSVGEISLKLELEKTTIKYHFENIYKKYNVRTRPKLMALAKKHKLF
jgi:DNA-binding NarL/FixJ family response regulator